MGSQLPPKRGTVPQFLIHVYCGQMAGCMKTPPGHIVVDGVPALRERGTAAPSPSCRPMSIVATVAHLSYCWALVFTFIPYSITRNTDVSRTITFPDRRFSEKLCEGMWMYIMCLNASSITRYRPTERLVMRACAFSIRGLMTVLC